VFFVNYNLDDKNKKNKLEGHVACVGRKKAIYGKLEGKTPLRKPSHIWAENIKNGL
jgi:hypothetical protein